MNIFLNEKSLSVDEGITAYEIKNQYKKDADVVILTTTCATPMPM